MPQCEKIRNPWLAATLSWFLPGIGQLYGGSFQRGFYFILFTFVFYLLTLWTHCSERCSFFITAAMAVVLFIVWPIVACVNAYRLVKQMNSKNLTAEKTNKKDPWLAIFLNVLLPGSGSIYLHKWYVSLIYIVIFFIFIFVLEGNLFDWTGLILILLFILTQLFLICRICKKKLQMILVFITFLLSFGSYHLKISPILLSSYLVKVTPPVRGYSMWPTIEFDDCVVGS